MKSFSLRSQTHAQKATTTSELQMLTRQTVLTSDIVAQMTDNHDGTYTYNYNVTRPGQITVSVLHYTNGGVYQEFFPNQFLSGDNGSNGQQEAILMLIGEMVLSIGLILTTFQQNSISDSKHQ